MVNICDHRGAYVLDLYCKLIWDINLSKYHHHLVAFVLIAPVISVVCLLAAETAGYTKGNMYCYVVSDPNNSNIYLLIGEIAIVTVLSVILFSTALIKIAYIVLRVRKGIFPAFVGDESNVIRNEAEETTTVNFSVNRNYTSATNSIDTNTFDNPDTVDSAVLMNTVYEVNTTHFERARDNADLLSFLGMPFIFLMINTLNFGCVCILSIQKVYTQGVRRRLLDEWGVCVFKSFYNDYNVLYPDDYFDIQQRNRFAFDVCGDEPKSNLNGVLVTYTFIVIFGVSIYLSIVFIKKDSIPWSYSTQSVFKLMPMTTNSDRVREDSSSEPAPSFIPVQMDGNNNTFSVKSKSYYTYNLQKSQFIEFMPTMSMSSSHITVVTPQNNVNNIVDNDIVDFEEHFML